MTEVLKRRHTVENEKHNSGRATRYTMATALTFKHPNNVLRIPVFVVEDTTVKGHVNCGGDGVNKKWME